MAKENPDIFNKAPLEPHARPLGEHQSAIKMGNRYVCPHCRAEVPVKQDCPSCKAEIDWSKI